MFQADDLDDILTEDSFSIIDKAVNSIQSRSPLKNVQVISKEKDFSPKASIPDSPNNHTFTSPETFSRNKRKRKFPGPAGLLPEDGPNNNTLRSPKNALASLSQNMLSQNQFPSTVFNEGPWMLMQSNLNKITKNDSNLQKFTINRIKNYANHPQLTNRKVPLVAGIIQSIDKSLPDPSLIIYDKTGEIQCTLHRDAWESFNSFIIPHFSCIILINSTILTTGSATKKIYLNITLNNILTIYADEEHIYSINENMNSTDMRNQTDDRFAVETDVFQNDRVTIVRNFLGENCLRSIEKVDSNKNSSIVNMSDKEAQDSIVNSTLDGINTDFLFDDFD